MRTRILHTKFWKDRFVAELTPSEKLIFNYLITNEFVNTIHIYELRDEQIIMDTGIDSGILESCKKKFEDAKKIYFKDGYVFLKNAYKYESYTGEKNDACKIKLFFEMGQEISDYFNTRMDTPMYRDYKLEIINKNIEIRNNKSKYKNQRLEGVKKGFEEFKNNY